AWARADDTDDSDADNADCDPMRKTSTLRIPGSGGSPNCVPAASYTATSTTPETATDADERTRPGPGAGHRPVGPAPQNGRPPRPPAQQRRPVRRRTRRMGTGDRPAAGMG